MAGPTSPQCSCGHVSWEEDSVGSGERCSLVSSVAQAGRPSLRTLALSEVPTPTLTPHRNETLASPSAASWQRLTEVAQTHLAQASGTKKFSGLHRRNKMYLSYFRDHVWGLGSLGRGTASSLTSTCPRRQTSPGSAVQDQNWEKMGARWESAQAWLRGNSLGRNTLILQELRNLKIETYQRHLGGGMVGLQNPGPRVCSWYHLHEVGFYVPRCCHTRGREACILRGPGRVFDTPDRRDEIISK